MGLSFGVQTYTPVSPLLFKTLHLFVLFLILSCLLSNFGVEVKDVDFLCIEKLLNTVTAMVAIP